MASKFHRNAILTGDLDAFCLVCESALKSEEEAWTHIDEPSHFKNLELIPYFEKFKDDRIRKVKMGYYCEFCNCLLSIVNKVNLHVAEDSHKHNKDALLLKIVGPDILAFEKVLIKERSWHGILENVCAVCNVEFDDESLHKSDSIHLLNLVQKPVKFGVNNAIYRQVDDDTIQCLTCEIVVAINTKTEHFNDYEHQSFYNKCEAIRNGDTAVFVPINNGDGLQADSTDKPVFNADKKEAIKEKSSKKDTKFKILDSIDKYQRHSININLEIETAFCKKCLVTINFDYDDMENHIANHSLTIGNIDLALLYPSQVDQDLNRVDINEPVQNSSIKSSNQELPLIDYNINETHGDTENSSESPSPDITSSPNDNDTPTRADQSKESTLEESITFATLNKITMNKGMHRAYCRICEKKIPSSLVCLKEHVAGALHKKNVESSKTSHKILKQSMKTFIDSRYFVTPVMFEEAAVINEKYYVTLLSYFMITKTDSRLRCQSCEVNLPSYDGDGRAHAQVSRHKRALDTTPVVTSTSSEFIREVRPGVFHCGYCNLVTGNWDETEMHLECTEHDREKRFALWRLRDLSPVIARHKQEEQMRELMFFRMMSNRFF